MDNWFGWLVFLGVAWFLSKPIREGFRSGLSETAGFDSKDFSLEVVGESNYQEALERVAGPKGKDPVDLEVAADVVCEDNNPHDKNAVRVEARGMTVGYLPREVARNWRTQVSAGRMSCAAVIRGGWDRGGGDQGHYGIWVKPPKEFKG